MKKLLCVVLVWFGLVSLAFSDMPPITDIFLSLPDTVVSIGSGSLSKQERQRLLDAYNSEQSYPDAETSIDYITWEHSTITMSNGFGRWTMSALPLKDSYLAIVIADRMSEDLQALEFYTYKKGKATKTEKFGYGDVKKRFNEYLKEWKNGTVDNVYMFFRATRGRLEVCKEIQDYGVTTVPSVFAFSNSKQKFVEFDYYNINPIGMEYVEILEKLYNGFVNAFNAKDYLLALQYVSNDAIEAFEDFDFLVLYDETLPRFLFTVINNGMCISGHEYSEYSDFSRIKSIKVGHTLYKDGPSPCIELSVDGKKIQVELYLIEETIGEGDVLGPVDLFTMPRG
ncbi:MAG: hypothetical protein IJU92_04805 [Spirochaetaceae bacterium]|nr:hypothetical protein [Spirochaetaceae bacterium]